MKKEHVFYYKFKKLNGWLCFNAIFGVLLVYACFCCPYMIFWRQMHVLWGCFLFSSALWCYKHFCKQRLAVITDEFIKIDHCAPLYWNDIVKAEERNVRCCFKKLRVIVLLSRQPFDDYPFNFLQKHNGEFTPFSIPLYDIVSDADIKKIRRLISKHVKIDKAS